MKKLFLIFVFGLMLSYSQAQSVTVVRLKSGIYIETGMGEHFDYWLSHKSKNILIQGMKTAIKWSDLNVNHKQSFTKEVCRFQAMNKASYKSHGYIPQLSLSETIKLVFKGADDGSSYCVIEGIMVHTVSSFGDYYIGDLTFNNKKQMQDFLKVLNGQSANPEIDNVFK